MSARSEIRPALDRLATELRVRFGVAVDVAMLRVLRDFGVACHQRGVDHAHHAQTIPAPAGDGADAGDVGPYQYHHHHHHHHARGSNR